MTMRGGCQTYVRLALILYRTRQGLSTEGSGVLPELPASAGRYCRLASARLWGEREPGLPASVSRVADGREPELPASVSQGCRRAWARVAGEREPELPASVSQSCQRA